jgi:hypothetical protein
MAAAKHILAKKSPTNFLIYAWHRQAIRDDLVHEPKESATTKTNI